jgi:hypothetical protein
LKSKAPPFQTSNWLSCNWIFNTIITTDRHWSTTSQDSSLRPTKISSSHSCQRLSSRQFCYSKCFINANWLSWNWRIHEHCVYKANFCMRWLAITPFHQTVWRFKYGLWDKFFYYLTIFITPFSIMRRPTGTQISCYSRMTIAPSIQIFRLKFVCNT